MLNIGIVMRAILNKLTEFKRIGILKRNSDSMPDVAWTVQKSRNERNKRILVACISYARSYGVAVIKSRVEPTGVRETSN